MNTIRELKQQEKYNNMLKRKNKEISILKDDKEHLGEFLKEKEDEIERLHSIIKEVRERIMLKQLRLVNEETYNILHSDLNELLEILDKKENK